MTTVVTTFSKDGYELYGHRMIETWLQYWPKDFKLQVYTEGYTLTETDSRLSSIDLESSCPDIVKFKNNSLKMLEQNPTEKRFKHKIFKTIKWCHKVYAMKHALSVNDDYLIFLDGDTYTTQLMSNTISKLLVGDDLFAVHFENLSNGLHFETGLIVFNLKHPQITWLRDILTTAYDSLNIYTMKKTWDGYWFAHLYKTYKLPVRNLAKERAGVFGNPLIHSALVHDVGSEKYTRAGYNEFTGRK
jgi:hypothetical protein